MPQSEREIIRDYLSQRRIEKMLLDAGLMLVFFIFFFPKCVASYHVLPR